MFPVEYAYSTLAPSPIKSLILHSDQIRLKTSITFTSATTGAITKFRDSLCPIKEIALAPRLSPRPSQLNH